MSIKYFTCFFLAATTLFGEITTYSPEEQTALDFHLKIWEEPSFRIDQHEKFVHKTIDRAILAVNENSLYLDYWEPVAKAWSRFIGVKPTLIYIGKKKVSLSEEVGEVIQIPPVKDVPTAFQAQSVRLLAPALFPDEVCVIADLDLFPINAEYLHRPIEELGDDSFIIYENIVNQKIRDQRIEFRMTYNAAKGKVFGEIFGVKDIEDIRRTLKFWYHKYHKKYGFHTDQRLLFNYLSGWEKFETHCYHLNRYFLTSAQSINTLKKQELLTIKPANRTHSKYTLDPKVIEDFWKGRYISIYLEKGHTPFNQFIYKTLQLDT